MIVKVLGTGCARCKNLEAAVKDIIVKNNIDAEVVKVTEIPEIMKYGILMTPGLVVNEKVVSSGIIPKGEQILQWLKQA